MLFHIIWVKEDNKPINNNLDNEEQQVARHNLDVLVEGADIGEVRKILEGRGIIIVSIKPFPENENIFGKIYLFVENDNKTIRIISYMDDLSDAAMFFFNVWLNVVEINYLYNPIEKKDSKKILDEAALYVSEQKSKIKEMMEKKKKQKENVFANQWLVKIRSIIDEVIARWDELSQRAIWFVEGSKIKKFKDTRSELSKLRMGTNQIKIVSVWEVYLNLMEEIETEFLEKKQNELGNIEILSRNSVVSNIDVMKEYSRFFKAIKTKGMGGSVKNQYGDYITFGLWWIYMKFFGADFVKKFKDIREVIYQTYDWVEFILIAIILEVVIYSVLKNFGGEIPLKNFVLLSNLWIIWIVLYFVKFIRRKNIMYLIILIPIIIILCIVLIRNLRINLAL